MNNISVMKKILKSNFIIFLIYFFLSVLYFLDFLIKGKILIAGDAFIQDFPLRWYYSQNFINKNGLHLWLPYEFLGLPFVGILQTGALYPLNFIYFFIPAPIAFNLIFLLHFSLAGFFTFLYAREIGIRPLFSFLAGIVFGFSGFMMAHKVEISMINAAAWLPLILYFYEKIKSNLNIKYSIYASFIIAIQVFAGHFQICVYTYLLIAIFILYYLFRIERYERKKFIFFSFLPIFLGSIIASPQIISTYWLSVFSHRTEWTYIAFSQFSFEPYMILQIFFPFIYGSAYGGEYWGSWYLPEMSIFTGILAFILSVIIFIKKRKENEKILFWGIVVILSFLLALGRNTPLYRIIYYIPVYKFFRVPARHFLLFSFGISILSAFGLENLSEDKKFLKQIIIGVLSVVFIGFLFYWIGYSIVHTTRYYVDLFTPEGKKVLSKVFNLNNKALLIPCLFVLLYSLILVIYYRFNSKILLILLGITVFLEGFSFGHFFYAYFPEVSFLKKNEIKEPVKMFLQKKLDNERVIYLYDEVPPLFNIPLKIHTLNGRDPLIINEFKFLTGIQPWGAPPSWNALILNNILLSTLNVKYVVKPKELNLNVEDIKGVDFDSLKSLKIQLGKWSFIGNVERKENEFVLKSSDGEKASLMYQEISLEPYNFYVLSLKAKAPYGAIKGIGMDLHKWPEYDRPEQELWVLARKIDKNYKTFFKVINTENIPKEVKLRLYTLSKRPIYVKDIKVIKYETPPFLNEDKSRKENTIYKKVFEYGKLDIYENKNCLPRVFSVERIISVKNINEVKEYFYLFKFNPAKEALVYKKDIDKVGKLKFSSADIKIKSYDTDKIVIESFSKGKSFLVLSDQYYPNWNAYIDGKKVQIYKVDGILRGIIVPEGKHIIEFKYEPMMFFISLFFSIVLTFGLIVCIKLDKFKKNTPAS